MSMNFVHSNLTWGKLNDLVDEAVKLPNAYLTISGLESGVVAYLVPLGTEMVLCATDGPGYAMVGDIHEYETLLSIIAGIDMTFPQGSVVSLRDNAQLYNEGTKWAGPKENNRPSKVSVDAFIDYMATIAPAGMLACCEWYSPLQDRNIEMHCGRIKFAGREFCIVGAGREGCVDYHAIPVEATKPLQDVVWENIHVSVEDDVYVSPYLAGLLGSVSVAKTTSRIEELQALDALCEECMSETCAYNPHGICRYPLVHGCAPHLDDDGCSGWLENGN